MISFCRVVCCGCRLSLGLSLVVVFLSTVVAAIPQAGSGFSFSGEIPAAAAAAAVNKASCADLGCCKCSKPEEASDFLLVDRSSRPPLREVDDEEVECFN